MSGVPVEWVLVIYYGLATHKATYGRLAGTTYTKDFIQLSKKQKFLSDLEITFPELSIKSSISLTYIWPHGSAMGSLVPQSADRPHLSWETKAGAPPPWRMARKVGESEAETIPGYPDHTTASLADEEFNLLGERGAGQPYLVAVKLAGQENTLHLRAYLGNPSDNYTWASSKLLPQEIRALVAETSQTSLLAWKRFSAESGEEPVLFNPARNHDAWGQTNAFLEGAAPDALSTFSVESDAFAEKLPSSDKETEDFRKKIEHGAYKVEDSYATAKTRGSAQRAFSEAVRSNYGGRCAVTGISTRELLVAAHIVPWGKDETIRLDPANGICLSLLIDKAFEIGLVQISDELKITIDWARVGDDERLAAALKEVDGITVTTPLSFAPKVEYLKRRRMLISGKVAQGT